MTVVRYEPWSLLNRLRRELDQNLRHRARDASWTPAVDIHEEPKQFVVHADLPGVKPADIEITAEKGVLALRGSRNFEQKNDDGHYSRIERVSGKFVRTFTLPENVRPTRSTPSSRTACSSSRSPRSRSPSPAASKSRLRRAPPLRSTDGRRPLAGVFLCGDYA